MLVTGCLVLEEPNESEKTEGGFRNEKIILRAKYWEENTSFEDYDDSE